MHISPAFRKVAARKIRVSSELEDDMGWNSAGKVFDPVAQALIDLGAGRDMKRDILGMLIEVLQENDWDTEDESMSKFKHDIDIVVLFVEHGIGSHLRGGDSDGTLACDGRGAWVLHCDRCGHLGGGPANAVEHDRLIRVWDAHDVAEHRGTGYGTDHLLLLDQEGDASA